MKIIFVRSPYFIEVDEATQVGSKIELFIWHKGETEPAAPTYTLSKKAASVSQTKNNYNISNYAKEFINIVNPSLNFIVEEEDNNNWVYVKVKRYVETTPASYTLLDTDTYVCFNGYTDYVNGYNYYELYAENVLTSLKPFKKYKYSPTAQDLQYINLFVKPNTVHHQIRLTDLNGDNEEFIEIIDNPDEDYLFRLPITNLGNEFFASGNIFEILIDGGPIFTCTFIPECEPKYNPILCSFINKKGGWEFITFFKARTESWEVKNKEYQLLPNDLDYNAFRGESKAFNYEAKQTIKINTGWLDEYYNNLIKEMMTSETILLNNGFTPVKLKTMKTDLKTSLQDKMINYEIEFEYNYNQINNVI